MDTDRNGGLIRQHKIFMSVGHDEYWSGNQRANVESARDAGVNLAFFSGNEISWKTRWEASIDGTNTPYRTLVCYKETEQNHPIDPDDPPTWTGLWRDKRFSPPADGGRPENALSGTISRVNEFRSDSISVPQADGRMRFWRNTSIASLAPGQVATLPAGTLGYEWDVDDDNGSRPAGLIPLSTTTLSVSTYLEDNYTIGDGVATHHLTLYRAHSGALVFGAGTIYWSWGLDATHLIPGTPTDPNMQQATVNLLADMGVQPATLQSGLVPATASTDTTPPKSAVTSPSPGTNVAAGAQVTISGTAQDFGGGVVGAVEVSLDGGTTWHPAGGRENWTYNAIFMNSGPVNVLSRAVDDSGNLEVPVSSAGVSVVVNPQPCPCTIWPASAAPANLDAGPDSSIELGVSFKSDINGYITGIRFYKSAANTGSHVGNLWNSAGTLLASATFTNETASGWQQVMFSSPVAITANTLYIASYHSPTGHYSADWGYFSTGVDNSPLHALANGSRGASNGLFGYGSTSVFPTSAFQSANYWVDVAFGTTTPLAIARNTLPNGVVSSPYSQNLNASGGTSPYTWSIQSGSLPPGLTLSSSGLISGTPTQAGSFNLTVHVTDSSSPAQSASASKSITINASSGCPCTLWSGTAAPANPDIGPDSSVELGVSFRSDVGGYITGIRFYKSAANTGTHVGNLWSATGTLLASATFTNETASGWQQVNFANPVAITANTVYVASYFSPAGHYSADWSFFAAVGVDDTPLHAPADGAGAPNGVFAYGNPSAFPANTHQSANYWVDAVFNTTPH